MYEKEIDILKVGSWTTQSKLVYIIRQLKSGRTKTELKQELVDDYGWAPKTFNEYWKQSQRVQSEIQFI